MAATHSSVKQGRLFVFFRYFLWGIKLSIPELNRSEMRMWKKAERGASAMYYSKSSYEIGYQDTFGLESNLTLIR